MNIATIKTYVESHLASAEEALKADFARVVAFVEGEEAKVKAEIADLEARGYTIIPPQPAGAPAAAPVEAAPVDQPAA